ncbi:MAG TPA: helix-turn-helix transcriptional regulator [Nocardioides sp.]
MTTGVNQVVADSIRAEMSRRKVTQLEVANALGVSNAAVSRRLSGRVLWDVDALAVVGQLLDMDPRDLLPEPATT